jgi:hypothetical protein
LEAWHFGLGSAERVTVEIRWPSGIHQIMKDLKADQFIVIEESTQP